jgi:hypothetical protein
MMQSRGKTATIIYSYRRASENEACAGRTARSGGYSRGVDDPRWRKRRGLRPANVSGAARFIYVRWPSPGRDAPRRGRNSGVESHHGRYRPPLTCPVDQSSGGSRHHRLKESPLGERGAEQTAGRARSGGEMTLDGARGEGSGPRKSRGRLGSSTHGGPLLGVMRPGEGVIPGWSRTTGDIVRPSRALWTRALAAAVTTG